jgi:hypothetical protein
MRTKLILGLAAVCIGVGAFVAGVLVERNYPAMLGSASTSPKLLSPVDGAVLKNNVPDMWEFSWSKVPKAERYHIYIAHSTLIDSPAVSQEMDVPVYRMPNPHLMRSSGPLRQGWTWKVKALVGGEWSKWSDVRTFDVEPKAE